MYLIAGILIAGGYTQTDGLCPECKLPQDVKNMVNALLKIKAGGFG